MVPELRVLRYFVAVAEELHFGRAAERVLVTQPALSRQIAELEEQLGVSLFTRTSRSVRLTDAGAALLVEARRTLAQAERAVEAARRAGRGEVGRVRVGFLVSACNSVLPPVVAQFQARYPAVTLDLEALLDGEQLRRLAEGEIDVGFVRTPPADPALPSEVVLREPLAVALPTGHRLANARQLELRVLADEPFILWPRAEATENYDGLLAACRAAGFSPRIALHLADGPAILGMVAAGLGVTILAHSYRVLGRQGVTFVPLPALTSTLRVVWALDQFTPPVARFLDVVREVAERTTPALPPAG
jgi:DNA-binding transcriptional LysR family regulator